jgi:hypothetical protein
VSPTRWLLRSPATLTGLLPEIVTRRMTLGWDPKSPTA